MDQAKLEKAEAEAEKVWKEVYETPKEEAETIPAEAEAVEEEEKKEEKKEEEPPKVVSEETWEQKYRTLEGKYRAEVPRLSNEVNQWRDYAASLTEQIKAYEALQKGTQDKAPEPEADADISAIETDYPDFAKVLKKIKADHAKEMAELRRELQTTISTDIKGVKEDLHVSKQDRFAITMEQLVPGWKSIDNDPAFMEWLNVAVPYTGTTRLALLQRDAKNLDATAVAQYFVDFKNETKAPEPETPAPDKLDKFTAPPRSGGPSVPKTGGSQGLTKAQYAKFMDPRYRFNPNDWGGKTEAQVEAMFDVAIQKGTLY